MNRERRSYGEARRQSRVIRYDCDEVDEKSGKPQLSANMSRDISIVNVRERMERLRHDVVNHVGDQFDDMMSEVMDGLEAINKFEGANALRLNENEQLYNDKRKSSDDGRLAEKQFLCRNSVLTDLYEIKHFRTIYNAFIAILIILLLNTVTYDLLHTGTTSLGVKLIMMGFGKFSIVIEIWFLMFAATFMVYAASNYWAHKRVKISPKSFGLKAWDYGWILMYLTFQVTFIIFPAYAIVATGTPPVSNVVILTEQVRLLMKTHAFVRSTAGVVTSHKPHSEGKEFDFPGFSKFLYFLFAPTLIYRDNYPRTKAIRWRFALWHLIEVGLVIFNMSFIFERTLIPHFIEFGKQPVDVRSFILSACGHSFPGLLIFLSGFYCLLHAWMNFAAEVMRFGDRLFYKDWWNATSFQTYYRHWNVVVHDWLYTYVYKDIYENVTPGKRILATTAVFTISAIFHEYILAFAFGFFVPVMLCMFGIAGYLLVFLLRTNSQLGNMFVWFALCTGSGFMISLYSIEYFARVNCPPSTEGFWDLIVPRTIVCFYKTEELR